MPESLEDADALAVALVVVLNALILAGLMAVFRPGRAGSTPATRRPGDWRFA